MLTVAATAAASCSTRKAPQIEAYTEAVMLAGDETCRLFVATNGDDGASGTTVATPLRTLGAAKARMRMLREQTRSGQTLSVCLRAGRYYQPETLVFDAEDSGLLGKVIYRAYRNENVVISGGEALRGFQRSPTNPDVYTLRLAGRRFRSLYYAGRRLPRVRYPRGWDTPLPRVLQRDEARYRVLLDNRQGQLMPLLASTAEEIRQTELAVSRTWMEYKIRLDRVEDTGNGKVWAYFRNDQREVRRCMSATDAATKCTLYNQYTNQIFEHTVDAGEHSRGEFAIENNPRTLLYPEQWVIDEARDELRLNMPGLSGPSALDGQVMAPGGSHAHMPELAHASHAFETLVELRGRPGAPVTRLGFEKLTFAHTNWLFPSERGFVSDGGNYIYLESRNGAGNPMTWVRRAFPAAVRVSHAESVHFAGNHFKNLEASGILLDSGQRSLRHIEIVNNRFEHLGGSGVHAVYPTDLRIRSNVFDSIGDSYAASSINLWAAQGSTIEGNTIREVTGHGMTIMGFGLYESRDNTVVGNELRKTMTRFRDSGAIYVNTIRPRTNLRIANNLIAEIEPLPWTYRASPPAYVDIFYHPFVLRTPIYLDRNSNEVVVENNTIDSERPIFENNGAFEVPNRVARNQHLGPRTGRASGVSTSRGPRVDVMCRNSSSVLRPGDSYMHLGEVLCSDNHRFVAMCSGHLTLAEVDTGRLLYQSAPRILAMTPCLMQEDGNFVLYGDYGPIFSTRTAVPGAYFKVTDAGDLQVLHGSTVLWSALQEAAAQQGSVSAHACSMGYLEGNRWDLARWVSGREPANQLGALDRTQCLHACTSRLAGRYAFWQCFWNGEPGVPIHTYDNLHAFRACTMGYLRGSGWSQANWVNGYQPENQLGHISREDCKRQCTQRLSGQSVFWQCFWGSGAGATTIHECNHLAVPGTPACR